MLPSGAPGMVGADHTGGKSTVCSVDAFGFNFEWTVNSAKHIPFDWSGP